MHTIHSFMIHFWIFLKKKKWYLYDIVGRYFQFES